MSEALDRLSPREREILALIEQGMPTEQTARALKPPCAEETVKEHLKRLFKKLGIHTQHRPSRSTVGVTPTTECPPNVGLAGGLAAH